MVFGMLVMHLNVHGCGWHGLSAYFGLEHLDEQTTPMPAPCGCHFSTLMGVGTLGFGGLSQENQPHWLEKFHIARFFSFAFADCPTFIRLKYNNNNI